MSGTHDAESKPRAGPLLGIALVALGIIAVVGRRFVAQNYRHVVDLGPYHEIIGAGLIAAGLYWIWISIRRRGP